MPTVYLHSFGCKVNQYETEQIRNRLKNFGYRTVEKWTGAELCVLNSCSVTAEADRKCRQWIRKILRENQQARMVVTGCYASRAAEEIRKISPRVEVFSNQEKNSLPEMLSGCSLHSAHSSLLTAFCGHTRAFVKVQDGCDATCTYCIIPKVRPKMESRSCDEIVQEVKMLAENGYKEMVLTGIRLGSYGLSSSGGRVGRVHGNLTELLRNLLQIQLPFRIRLSSIEITEITEELLKLVQTSERICRHFHIPLQSGDERILKRMGRWYTATFFSEQIQRIREALPDVGLTTDVMVGFPGEGEEEFKQTREFLKKHFNGMHVFPFSARPNTPAEKLLPRTAPSLIRQRVSQLRELDQQLRREFRRKFAGTRRMVLAETSGGFTDNGIWIPAPLPFPQGTLDLVEI